MLGRSDSRTQLFYSIDVESEFGSIIRQSTGIKQRCQEQYCSVLKLRHNFLLFWHGDCAAATI